MRDGLKKFAKAAAFRNADGEEEDAAHARKPKKKSADATAAVSATFPVDVVMLLAEPRVLQLLLEHCLDTMHEATASHKLPKVSYMPAAVAAAGRRHACTGADPALLLLCASLCPSGTQIAAQVLAPRPDWRDVALKPDLREGGLHVFGMSSMLWGHPLQRSLPAPIRCAVRRSIDCCGAPLAAKRGSEQSGAFTVLPPACRAIPSARCAAARCARRPRACGLACSSTQKLNHHLLCFCVSRCDLRPSGPYHEQAIQHQFFGSAAFISMLGPVLREEPTQGRAEAYSYIAGRRGPREGRPQARAELCQCLCSALTGDEFCAAALARAQPHVCRHHRETLA